MELLEQAQTWLEQDPDENTRAELERLIAARDLAALQDAFGARLQFGTAGLRGELGPGPNRMNRVIVAQAAAGLADYLTSSETEPSVVIGYDARHMSETFARDTAEIMSAAGVRAYVLPRHLPTPTLAFAIGHLECSAGVMVTASHNPPRDNGYKVYLSDTSQIVPPADIEISAAIDAVGPVNELPRSSDYTIVDEEVVDAYINAVLELAADGPREVVAVYTPMHGVGRETLDKVVAAAHFAALHTVETQADPDPDFPTVAFPNPEEPGAMDLALELAAEVSADIIIANDPDADRCAVGVATDDGYRMLTGDQVGALLGDLQLRRGVQGAYASSIVSSDLLGRQASAYDQPWQQTLTGFKWIGKIPDVVYGYEEALGYSVAPHIARDKDGISAALAILELAAELKADGRTLVDKLHDIYSEHGWHATGQLSVRVSDVAIIANAMDQLRTQPPRILGGLEVTSIDDLQEGYQGLPPTDGIRLGISGGSRIICRPSGTEPKLKCYIEVVVPVGDSLEAAQLSAESTLDRLKSDLADRLGL